MFTAGAQLGFCSGGWGSLNPKIKLFLKMNITIFSIHCRCATRILFRRLGELESKDQVIPKNVALGRRAKQRGLTHAHHRQGLKIEPKAAGQFLCIF